MRVLGYSQILTVLRKGFIKFNGIEYSMEPVLQAFVEENLPSSGNSFVTNNMLLVARFNAERNAGEIVGFVPGNPPDPGMPEVR